jgi:demethylmenaquinone methyltransferase / 2-methoxy-6-polyprenyl-1,4-benzoquinol methylase
VHPGGRVVVLELTAPARAPLSLFYGVWFDRIVPTLGRGLGALLGMRSRARDGREQAAVGEAYSYLPRSVKRFPAPAELADEMERAGLREVAFRLLAGGIIAIHVGTVPPAPEGSPGEGPE